MDHNDLAVASDSRVSAFDLEAALAALPACVRCKARRIKCDAALPACINCEKATEDCKYRDHVLASTVSRSDLATLVTRFRELNAMKASQPNIAHVAHRISHSEVDKPPDTTPSVYISETQKRNIVSFWGPFSLYSMLGKAMVTMKCLPPPETTLERTGWRMFDLIPRPNSGDVRLPEKHVCQQLLGTYYTSIETFYPIFGWARLAMLIDNAYTLSAVQDNGSVVPPSNSILFLLLAVTMQLLSQADRRLAGHAKAYYQAFEQHSMDQRREKASLETFRVLLLRALYSLQNQSMNHSWHILGIAHGMVSEILPEFGLAGNGSLLTAFYNLEIHVAVAFRRPTMLTEVPTLGLDQEANIEDGYKLAHLVYRISRLRYYICSYNKPIDLDWEAIGAEQRQKLEAWIADWNTVSTTMLPSPNHQHETWLCTAGSAMYNQCLFELLEKVCKPPSNTGEMISVALRLIESYHMLYTATNVMQDQRAGLDTTVFPFFWTHTHVICNACLFLLREKAVESVMESVEIDKAIKRGLALILALDSSHTLFRTIWSLQGSE